jgi:hypothetical protein
MSIQFQILYKINNIERKREHINIDHFKGIKRFASQLILDPSPCLIDL